MDTQIKIVILIAFLSLSGGNFAWSNPTFEKARKDYAAGKYAVCLQKLEALGQSNSDLVHYYKALCHQRTNQATQAKSEYSWVAKNSTNPSLRANAGTALRSMNKAAAHSSYSGAGNVFSQNQPQSSSRSDMAPALGQRLPEPPGWQRCQPN
ncbi:MAG: hypothetical protein K2W82_01270 [Candidatus Obscuribacterales bacterium]|nr:hypothetical protein [Candidatus Obscuribacterales bacterium]